jgi:hypothetical protein
MTFIHSNKNKLDCQNELKENPPFYQNKFLSFFILLIYLKKKV